MPSSREKMTSSREKMTYKSSIQEAKEFGKMPKYKAPVYSKPERVDDMYPLKWTDYDNADVQKGIEKVLGPLSLFAPFTHEDVPDNVPLQLERPVTPINEEIRTQPSTFERMARFVRRRIMAHTDVPYLSVDDQKNLAAIILGEVNGIWPDIRRQIDDPFLTPEENKELNRRIAVHIVTVCEQLFKHYLDKAQVLNSRGVFSGPANMSRLKAQLALEANELLDVLKIRRYIVHDMRSAGDAEGEEAEMSQKSPRHARSSSAKKLTYQAMLEASRPKPKQLRSKLNTIDQDIKEIQEQIPVLDTSHLLDFVAELPERDIRTPSEEEFHARPSRISEGVSRMSGISKEDVSKRKIIYKPNEAVETEGDVRANVVRCKSQPDLSLGETLLEELGIPNDVRDDKLMQNELSVLQRERASMLQVLTDRETKPGLGTREFIENDLRKLTEHKDDEFPDGDDADDLPPLIQAITRHARHDDMKARMEKQLKELEEREKKRQEDECVFVQGPTYPQPDTVSTNMGNKGVVRTSDIRVSERVCMSSITLKCHSTVYNDLLEEIDPLTVKNLDKNLFLSDEIQEVYKEIMKSVPSTHMELDDDPLVLNAPDSVNVAGTMASSSLSRKVVDRVINPAFIKAKGPPWGSAQMKEWARTPVNPPKNFLGEDIFSPVTPNMAKINETMHNPAQMNQMMTSVEGMPNIVADKMSRTYASWLQWWKSTVSSDDYMKYLSTLESDYMGAVFHFYDSGEESESEDEELTARARRFSRTTTQQNSTRSKVTSEQRERARKITELKQIKTEYKEGFWNANAVLMGGLGKEPELAEENIEEKAGDRTSRSVESTRTVTIQERANQLRVLPEKRDLISRMSKATTGAGSEVAASSSEPAEEIKKGPQPQERLESVWQQLLMPDAQRLDMAIKYSCNEYYERLAEAIERWELIAELILQRESLLTRLEKFERQASDPNRFFHKGSKKSSYRLEESRKRTYFSKKIDALDVEIKEEIEYIKDQFQDVITFKGRPYLDKMRWDRTEMLYWLSEERKRQGLQYEAITRGVNLPLRHAQLQPIMPQQ
ncbi:coiled-coil domain-containing protein 87 isoform X2 [Aplysia californica]|uniref:Coiled-coil domain-containing protein 87 isoform X2 n=1 Tax=Aplysia californica TaxID=6500 RepID=A0ABM1A8E0_APLCA|nr:coiled-coil domain-containing protein 87 isoform X2 [Aplysia californica]